MSLWFDKDAKRYRIRIQRRGRETKRILPAGITKAQADQAHAQIIRAFYDQAELGKRPGHSISEAITKLIEEELPKIKTKKHVESNIRALLPFVQGRQLSDIGEVAKEYAKDAPSERKERLTTATINRRLAVLRRVANLAFKEWGWLDRPVFISLAQENNERHEYLSRGEAELLAWFAAQWDEATGDECLIAAYSGMRRGEIESIKPGTHNGTNVGLKTTKNGKPRIVPIIPRIKKNVERWAKADRPHPRTRQKVFKLAAAAIGRPGLHFHDLRHTTASLLINLGVDLYTVGEILGHLDKRSTARYAHLSTDSKRKALERLVG